MNKKQKIEEIQDDSIATLKGHTDYVDCIAVLPDGRIASGSRDKKIIVWDSGTCKEVGRMVGHSDFVKNLVPLPNNRLLSSAYYDPILVWDTMTFEKIGSIKTKTTPHDICCISNDTFAFDEHNRICIFDLKDKSWRYIKNAHDMEGSIYCLVLHSNNILMSGGWDGMIHMWNIESLECVGTLASVGNPVSSIVVINKQTIISGTYNGVLTVWDIPSKTIVTRLGKDRRYNVSGIVSISDKYIAGGGNTGYNISIFKLKRSKLRHVGELVGHSSPMQMLAMHRNGRLLSCSTDKSIKMWDVSKWIQ